MSAATPASNLIEVPGQEAFWRYDQIAAIELRDVDDEIIVTPVNGHSEEGRQTYSYETDEARPAYEQLVKAWKAACA